MGALDMVSPLENAKKKGGLDGPENFTENLSTDFTNINGQKPNAGRERGKLQIGLQKMT
jgi:hypothetical protein